MQIIEPTRQGLKNTPTASLQRGKTPPNACHGYDTKLYVMVIAMKELYTLPRSPELEPHHQFCCIPKNSLLERSYLSAGDKILIF